MDKELSTTEIDVISTTEINKELSTTEINILSTTEIEKELHTIEINVKHNLWYSKIGNEYYIWLSDNKAEINVKQCEVYGK